MGYWVKSNSSSEYQPQCPMVRGIQTLSFVPLLTQHYVWPMNNPLNMIGTSVVPALEITTLLLGTSALPLPSLRESRLHCHRGAVHCLSVLSACWSKAQLDPFPLFNPCCFQARSRPTKQACRGDWAAKVRCALFLITSICTLTRSISSFVARRERCTSLAGP